MIMTLSAIYLRIIMTPGWRKTFAGLYERGFLMYGFLGFFPRPPAAGYVTQIKNTPQTIKLRQNLFAFLPCSA